MKKFILKTLILSIIPLFAAIAVIIIFKIEENKIKIDESIKTIILGDSHTQAGINDNIVKNSINVSQSSEHFLYTFNVLKLLINNNPQIDKIILGVSFHSFGSSNDEFKTINMFPKYFQILDSESICDINKIPIKEGRGILRNIINSIRINYSLSDKFSIHSHSFIGSYYKSNKSNLNDSTINAAIKRHYFLESGEEKKFSKYKIKYLKKIVEFCNEKNIEIIFINTPIHNRYYARIPEKFITNYYSTIEHFGEKISFYDFHSVKLKEDCYGDADHLNLNGAKIQSMLINEMLDIESAAQNQNIIN